MIGYEHAFTHAVADFIQAVAVKRAIHPDFDDGVRAIAVLEAAKRSAADGNCMVVA